MQQFLGPITTEGILASGIMAIARCLTEPEVGQVHPSGASSADSNFF